MHLHQHASEEETKATNSGPGRYDLASPLLARNMGYIAHSEYLCSRHEACAPPRRTSERLLDVILAFCGPPTQLTCTSECRAARLLSSVRDSCVTVAVIVAACFTDCCDGRGREEGDQNVEQYAGCELVKGSQVLNLWGRCTSKIPQQALLSAPWMTLQTSSKRLNDTSTVG